MSYRRDYQRFLLKRLRQPRMEEKKEMEKANDTQATADLKLDGGGFEPPAFLAAALAAACWSASCLAARKAALLFVLGVILGAAKLLGRGFNFEADDGGRRKPVAVDAISGFGVRLGRRSGARGVGVACFGRTTCPEDGR
jgi:hypothetical protein